MNHRIAEELPETYRSAPQPNTYWRHFEGTLYIVACISLRESDKEVLITYYQPLTIVFWTRPLSQWQEMVTKTDGTTVKRFAPAYEEDYL